MAHQIENMFSVKETPWHNLGSVIQNAPTVAEGIVLAGADWEVEKKSLFFKTAEGVEVNLDDFQKAMVRKDNGVILGTVGPKTEILQNKDAFAFFDPIIASGEATLETAGVLDEGRKIWVMAKCKLDPFVIAKDDEVLSYVLLSNSHDGTMAVRVGFTPIRVVCANTLAIAHGSKDSQLIRVRHSRKVKENLSNIRDVMKVAEASFQATAEQYKLLATRNINQNDLREYVKAVFKMNEDENELATRSKNVLEKILANHEAKTGMLRDISFQTELAARMAQPSASEVADKLLESITERFETPVGGEVKSTKGSWWTAYNAVNEELNYGRGHSDDTRMNSLWFGDSAKKNAEALELALEMAGS